MLGIELGSSARASTLDSRSQLSTCNVVMNYYINSLWGGMGACRPCTCVQVRGQLAGVGFSFCHVGPWVQINIIRLHAITFTLGASIIAVSCISFLLHKAAKPSVHTSPGNKNSEETKIRNAKSREFACGTPKPF